MLQLNKNPTINLILLNPYFEELLSNVPEQLRSQAKSLITSLIKKNLSLDEVTTLSFSQMDSERFAITRADGSQLFLEHEIWISYTNWVSALKKSGFASRIDNPNNTLFNFSKVEIVEHESYDLNKSVSSEVRNDISSAADNAQEGKLSKPIVPKKNKPERKREKKLSADTTSIEGGKKVAVISVEDKPIPQKIFSPQAQGLSNLDRVKNLLNKKTKQIKENNSKYPYQYELEGFDLTSLEKAEYGIALSNLGKALNQLRDDKRQLPLDAIKERIKELVKIRCEMKDSLLLLDNIDSNTKLPINTDTAEIDNLTMAACVLEQCNSEFSKMVSSQLKHSTNGLENDINVMRQTIELEIRMFQISIFPRMIIGVQVEESKVYRDKMRELFETFSSILNSFE